MKKITLSAAMLSLMMVACTNNEEIITTNDEGIQTISAEILQPESANASRVIVGGKPGDATRPLTWRADDPATKLNEADAIYVYDSKGNAARFIYSETADATKGIFTRDGKVGSPIEDIKSALCVTSSVGNTKQLPATIESEFAYMSTMMFHRGAENAPMYGTMGENGILEFKPVTALVELTIGNLIDFRSSVDSQIGIRFEAFEEGNETAKSLSSTLAKLVNTANPDSAKVELTGKDSPYIGLFLSKNVSVDNKLYFPVLTGNYSKFRITIFPNTAFNDETKAVSDPVTIVLNKQTKKNVKIEKKLYSFTINNIKKIK